MVDGSDVLERKNDGVWQFAIGSIPIPSLFTMEIIVYNIRELLIF